MRFVDSNVWLYAMQKAGDSQKREQAALVVKPWALTVSTQVINEVCNNLRRKSGFTESEVEKVIESFYKHRIVVPLDRASMLKACELRGRYSFSFWDSQLVACALLAGCTVLESEDMQDGLVIEGTLTIRNPFKQ